MSLFDSQRKVCQWLEQFSHPLLIEGWSHQPGLVTTPADGTVRIEFPFCAKTLEQDFVSWLQRQPDQPQSIEVSFRVKALETQVSSTLPKVKNIIAVSSGKGGVGKSTTAVNLALALKAQGAEVGLLDADIYGPSVPIMLGKQDDTPGVRDGKYMIPIEAYGLYSNSIGYLVDQAEAAIWRGPMASKALGQLLQETDWPELDYLVIDMPPGTGDVQLTLSQQIPVTGALIITTPQDLALADAGKGLAMFAKVEVPVIGIVENMSYHICSHCGAKEHIFGVNGAEKMAKEHGTTLLAQIPLHISMREDIDAGCPTVAARPESEHALRYAELAQQVASKLYWTGKPKPEAIPFTSLD